MNIIKYSCYAIGGAVGLSAAAAFGGIGVVAGGAAVGLSALEVAIVGGGTGVTIAKIREDQARAKRATEAAQKAKRAADAQQAANDIKIARARKALEV